jgi:pyruvate dehydrogenase E1 component
LIPIGTVYDLFVLRGLDALIYGTYIESRFIVVGTPSGVTLSYEGGAHQSIVTPSVGMELPNIELVEPTFAGELDWLLCDSVGRLFQPDGMSAYFRLSTRPIDQVPFDEARARLGGDELRRQVLAGGYCIRDVDVDGPPLTIAASGAVLPEALEAARVLEDEGVSARVLNLTSADRLFRTWREALRQAVGTSTGVSALGHLATLFPSGPARTAPIVAVQDAAPHALAWLGAPFGARVIPLGVEHYGQSGSLSDTYRWHQLDVDAIVNAGLVATAGAYR